MIFKAIIQLETSFVLINTQSADSDVNDECSDWEVFEPLFNVFYFQHTGVGGEYVWHLACQCFRRGLQDNSSEIYWRQTWKWKEVVSRSFKVF